jgi:hypothetical protein
VFIGYLADAALEARNLHLALRGSCASDGVLRPTDGSRLPGQPRWGRGVRSPSCSPNVFHGNVSSCDCTLHPLAGSHICQVAIFLGMDSLEPHLD